jgi:hypothetical protein
MALSVLPLAALLPALSTACGTDVAGCADVCGTGSDTNCSTDCTDTQTVCESSNDSADFQTLITCISNANGVFEPLPVLCVPAQKAVKANCTGHPLADGG